MLHRVSQIQVSFSSSCVRYLFGRLLKEVDTSAIQDLPEWTSVLAVRPLPCAGIRVLVSA